MQYRHAVALLESLEVQLHVCLSESRRPNFRREDWYALRDLLLSEAFADACREVEWRGEDLPLLDRLSDLDGQVNHAVQGREDMSPEELAELDGCEDEVFPLFAGMA